MTGEGAVPAKAGIYSLWDPSTSFKKDQNECQSKKKHRNPILGSRCFVFLF